MPPLGRYRAEQAFFDALELHDSSPIAAILQHGEDPNILYMEEPEMSFLGYVMSYYFNPLLLAQDYNYSDLDEMKFLLWEIIQILMLSGANINWSRAPAWHVAILSDSEIRTVRQLLNWGANPNQIYEGNNMLSLIVERYVNGMIPNLNGIIPLFEESDLSLAINVARRYQDDHMLRAFQEGNLFALQDYLTPVIWESRIVRGYDETELTEPRRRIYDRTLYNGFRRQRSPSPEGRRTRRRIEDLAEELGDFNFD